MNDPESPGLPPSAPTNVPDLIDDYRKQQEAWRVQAQEIARQRAEILSAAEREASRIVTTARAEIRRIIVNARGELLGLATQVQAITETDDGLQDQDGVHMRNRLLEARRDLRGVLDESAPDLERLSHDAVVARPIAQHIAQPPVVQPSARPGTIEPVQKPAAPRRSYFARGWIAAFAVTGLMIALGTAWWMRSGRPGVARAPAAAAPTPALAPQASDQPPASAQPQAVVSEGARRSALSLVIEAQRPAWIQATIDGRTDAGRVFQPGDTNKIDAEREVLLRVGDAGAVLVSRNGAEREVLGRDGVVVTRRFERDQAPRTPAAISSPSPPRSPQGAAAAPSPTAPPAAAGNSPGPPAASPAAVTSSATSPASSSAMPGLTPPVSRGAATPSGNGSAGARPPAEPPPNAGPELTSAAERWLDAFYRRDPTTIASGATSAVKVSDERAENERLPAGLSTVRRTLERVTFQFAGESAILTARMTEGANVGGELLQHVSWVSQVWIREAGQWRLLDVRMVSDTKLK